MRRTISTIRIIRTIRVLMPFALLAGWVPAADAQVDLSIGVPGVYGRIDIGGGEPPPQTIYRQPIVVDRGPRYEAAPLYLHVPPDHARNWRRYCRAYDACGRPVYFVRDDWYRNVYAPRYRESHRPDDRRGHDDGPRGDDHRGRDDHGHDDRGRDDHGRDDHGNHGNGRD